MGEPTAYVTSGSQDRDGGGGVGDSDVPEEMERETRLEPATNSLEMNLPFNDTGLVDFGGLARCHFRYAA